MPRHTVATTTHYHHHANAEYKTKELEACWQGFRHIVFNLEQTIEVKYVVRKILTTTQPEPPRCQADIIRLRMHIHIHYGVV